MKKAFAKFSAKWGVQIAGIFFTGSGVGEKS
ncbi:DUF6783 domain-containing protein [Blautia sp. HCP3S3_H10_1]